MTPTTCSRIRHVAMPLAVMLTLATAMALEAGAVTSKIRRVSVTSAGAQVNGHSYDSSISAQGRFIGFASEASNLVAGDTNGVTDVFIHDRETGTTRRVSVSSDGTQGNGNSAWPSISADGRFVAFESDASNLVGGDTNGYRDVFVRDRETGTTRRVSVRSDGTQGNGSSLWPSISANGRVVAFSSEASNLVGGDSNGADDVFVRDRETGTTKRASVSSAGAQGDAGSHAPAISGNGRFVAFQSDASSLVGGDTTGYTDIFVRDRQTATTRRVSASSAGDSANADSGTPSISANGRFVAFESGASNLVAGDTGGIDDVFVRDRQTDRTTRVSVNSDSLQGNEGSSHPSVSADGRFVTFQSSASNLAYGDTNGFSDVFLHDRQTGTTRRLSLNSAGTIQTNDDSFAPYISADGRFVVFESDATTLVEGDTNGYEDVFVRGPML